jgi:DNA-binding NtrC family response regulator
MDRFLKEVRSHPERGLQFGGFSDDQRRPDDNAIGAIPQGVEFSAMTGSSRHLCVLVVEDEALIRWSIAEALAQKGHRVVEAGDARGAVQALSTEREPIDVVLLDYRLPDSDDLGLLKNVRRMSPQSAVVMMTAFGTPEVTRDALDLGVYRVLNKPFDIHGIEPLLQEAHESRSGASARPH